jgi:anti-anti-sigma factor
MSLLAPKYVSLWLVGWRFLMHGTSVVETHSVGELTELVRGEDARFLERLLPLVRTRSLALDMSPVERIDAAGIAALITLYCAASRAGHAFSVAHASPRVEEILCLVGLERILTGRDAVEDARLCGCLELTAA